MADNRITTIPDWIKPNLSKYDLHKGLNKPEKKIFGIPISKIVHHNFF